jgi:hypothetical protein
MTKRKAPEGPRTAKAIAAELPSVSYTLDQVLEILQVSRPTLLGVTRRGELRTVTLTPYRVAVLATDLAEFIAAR